MKGRLIGMLALGVFLGLLAAGGLVGRRPARPARPESPDQVKMRELFLASASQAIDPALLADYHSVNAGYFSSKLPEVRIRWEPRLAEIGPLIADGFQLDGATNGRVILMNPAIRGDAAQVRRVLCHEMVHVAVPDEPVSHGPRFQATLRQLSEKGAFEGVVATDEEREALHDTLQAQVKELDREEQALKADRREYEEKGAPTQAHVDAFNIRVRRHLAAIDEYNQLVAQYNLMIAYPDGLDRQRMEQRTSTAAVR